MLAQLGCRAAENCWTQGCFSLTIVTARFRLINCRRFLFRLVFLCRCLRRPRISAAVFGAIIQCTGSRHLVGVCSWPDLH